MIGAIIAEYSITDLIRTLQICINVCFDSCHTLYVT